MIVVNFSRCRLLARLIGRPCVSATVQRADMKLSLPRRTIWARRTAGVLVRRTVRSAYVTMPRPIHPGNEARRQGSSPLSKERPDPQDLRQSALLGAREQGRPRSLEVDGTN